LLIHDVLSCPEACFTFKRAQETDEVTLHKLALTLDALMSKREVREVATQERWQPKAAQTTCP
jgi:hypothetical protein